MAAHLRFAGLEGNELANPDGAGNRAEDDVGHNRRVLLGVIAERLVFGVQEEAPEEVHREPAQQRDDQHGHSGPSQRRDRLGRQRQFFDGGTTDQSEAERGAHQAGEQGNQHPFAEVVFSHRFFLFLFRQFLFLGHAGQTDQHDAEERHQHATEGADSRVGLEQLAEFAFQDFRHDGSRRRTEAAAHGQTKTDAEVTDHQPPGQSAKAPRRAAKVAIPKFLARRGFEDAERVRRFDEGQRPRHDEQREQRPKEPVAFPGPVFLFFERQIKHRAGKSAQGKDDDAQGWIGRGLDYFIHRFFLSKATDNPGPTAVPPQPVFIRDRVFRCVICVWTARFSRTASLPRARPRRWARPA